MNKEKALKKAAELIRQVLQDSRADTKDGRDTPAKAEERKFHCETTQPGTSRLAGRVEAHEKAIKGLDLGANRTVNFFQNQINDIHTTQLKPLKKEVQELEERLNYQSDRLQALDNVLETLGDLARRVPDLDRRLLRLEQLPWPATAVGPLPVQASEITFGSLEEPDKEAEGEEEISFLDIPEYGELYPIEEFVERVDTRQLPPGIGEMATATKTAPSYKMSPDLLGDPKFAWPPWCTHVVWYLEEGDIVDVAI